MSDDFFRTLMGRKFYEDDVPKIASALECIAKSLEKQQTAALDYIITAPAGRRVSIPFGGRAQPTWEEIRGEHTWGIPGILFPIDHGGECDSKDGTVFIARDDEAAMFLDDLEAANFVARLIKKPWKKFFDVPGTDYFHPYFEIPLSETYRIHTAYGTQPSLKKEGL